MKHKAVFNKVRKFIDERELVEENLDLAEDELLSLIEKDPNCDWAFGLLSEIYYWCGEIADAEDKMEFYKEGVEYGEQGVEVNNNSLEANFWLAVNYGSFGTEKGIMKSLELVNPMKTCLERAMEVDESYFYGGPWRVLGRLYHKAPGWPFSIGNNKKAIECLENALEFGPKFYLNHLFLAEAYISNWDKDKAKEHLEWIIKAPLSKNHEREDKGYKKQAKDILNKL